MSERGQFKEDLKEIRHFKYIVLLSDLSESFSTFTTYIYSFAAFTTEASSLQEAWTPWQAASERTM